MSEVDRGASGPGEWPGWAGRVTRVALASEPVEWPGWAGRLVAAGRASGPGASCEWLGRAGPVAQSSPCFTSRAHRDLSARAM